MVRIPISKRNRLQILHIPFFKKEIPIIDKIREETIEYLKSTNRLKKLKCQKKKCTMLEMKAIQVMP